VSALIQQIKIANMNANDPAMTKSSAMSAGIVSSTDVYRLYLSMMSLG
jgi:hypothetical protein